MKLKKVLISLIVLIITISISIEILKSNAAGDSIRINLSQVRYKYNYDGSFSPADEYDNKKAKYGIGNKTVFQLISLDGENQITGKNFYCIKAGQSYTWDEAMRNGTAPVQGNLYSPVTYNFSKELRDGETTQQEVSKYFTTDNFKQVMWILNNMYVLDINTTKEQNLQNKRAVLAKAGLVYGTFEVEGLYDTEYVTGYKYEPVPGYNYSGEGWIENQDGYLLNDNEAVELSDEQVEVVQQAAIWYFTNKDDSDHPYDKTSQPTTWLYLDGDPFVPSEKEGREREIMIQEQASIYYKYLIDAAKKAAESESTSTETPIQVEETEKSIDTKTISGKYIVGPIKFKKINDKPYTLTMSVTGDDSSEAYISNKQGVKSQKDLATLARNLEEFYVTVPAKCLVDGSVNIKFSVNYKKIGKVLWDCNNQNGEQPIVQVEPEDVTDNLNVPATLDAKFDLALRKAIVAVTDAKGNSKFIGNEKKYDATRKPTYKATDININQTATYNQRKDPVVVEKGDIIKYAITVYNEGDKRGYANEIIDQLPDGLILKGYKQGQEDTKRGEYKKEATENSKAVDYTYEYDETENKITFTNNNPQDLTPYQGGDDTLDSVTIEIECEVVQDPLVNENTYLTNIAYISKEHDSVLNEDIVEETTKDRDSEPGTKPNKNKDDLKTTGDEYNGYKGNADNNSVYDDTNNNNYYKGEQDDDDFEIVVVQPLEFDLALKKHISAINGDEEKGRTAPTIDSKDLADNSKTTAKYTLDKTPIKVKNGDFITYTFTVYNEGDIAGYVNKITDNIPTGLQFVYRGEEENKLIAVDSQGISSEIEVDSDIYNLVEKNSYWSIDKQDESTPAKDSYNGEQTISITCDVKEFLGGENTLLNAYDKEEDAKTEYKGDGLSKVSVSVVFRVSALDGSGVNIRNEAAITEAEDTQGHKQDQGQDPELKDADSKVNEWPGKDGDKKYEDDEDYDNVVLEKIDLALSKFIAAVSKDEDISDGEYLTADKNEGSKTNPYLRATKVDTTELKAGTSTDAKYEKDKTPLKIADGSYVLYDIRVYNEGEVDCYAAEIKDYLPEYLEFVDCDFNKVKNGWVLSEDGRTITTDILSYEKSNPNALKAFDKENDNGAGSGLDYRDLQVLCKLSDNAPKNQNIVNTAEITKYENEKGEDLPEDIDSTPDNKDEEHEDDDDYENVVLKSIDLALSKFIAAISNDVNISDGEYLTADGKVGSKTNPYSRATKVDTTELKAGTATDAKYEKDKTPLTVASESYILYDIRVYNEGEVDCYAAEVKDYLPDYLEFVNCEFNDNYGWKVEGDGKTISTDILSYEKSNPDALKAFDKENDDGAGSGLDYRDLQVLCKVSKDAPTNHRMVNVAEISKYQDEEGNEVEEDEDSKPENVQFPYDKNQEDDDDYDNVMVQTFDLNLLKYISTIYITEDGTTQTIQTGNTGANTDSIPKVEIHRNKVDSTIVKFGYTIKVTNEGDIEGYAKEITDYVPAGLKFNPEDNEGWTDKGNNVISTRLLENTLLKPGDSAEVTVIFTWINGNDNLGLKTNIAEISEDYNEKGIPDRDSTPNNKVEGEDDIDDAQVLLSVSTGITYNIIKYAIFGGIILIILGTGTILIKKYVI